MAIDLPISKSIANRLLMLQAIHGDPLLEVSCDMPDDVRLIHDVLSHLSPTCYNLPPTTYHLSNCGTAMRFLTAYCAQLEGCEVVLDGDERMHHRPIGQLVDALVRAGAHIEYIGEQGYPPLRIMGRALPRTAITLLHPQSSQFVSALLLMGFPVTTDCRSPYIAMTQHIIANYRALCIANRPLEKDWSAAAFWYEYVALHGGELELPGLSAHSVQGDKVVADLFRPLGVATTYTDTGIRIRRTGNVNGCPRVVDFTDCPDLYPAVAITYRQLAKPLIARGTASLRIKESDRIKAVQQQTTYHDHRIAMALLAADLPCDDKECVSKSYPRFVEQLSTVNSQFSTVIPRRGINDEGKGKKYALHKLISAATTDYVWLMDDDVLPAPILHSPFSILHFPADLYILPLKMVEGRSLLERLQVAEYAAIQEVTMRTAKRGKAVMCSGANLIVRRERWLESYADLHTDIPSGDDMFLLESFRRRGLQISVIDRPEYTATVTAIPSWRAFFRQRMRWAGKAPHYTDRYIIRYGAVVLGANMLQLLCPPVLLVKFPYEYRLIKKRDPQVSFWIALLLEVLYPYYMLLVLLGGLFRRSW
ncbi:MAG: glycosyltransferase [Paludibacteraceae bacterium]|nr:glycosyltransferase [Paludibacteraceae bacterium]